MTATDLEAVLDRPQPQAPDAERAVLGAVLINNRAFFRVNALIDTADFFKDAHRVIYALIKRMLVLGDDVDPLTLKDELAKHGHLDQVGGIAYVSALLDSVPDVANVERYAEIIRDRSKRRRMIAAGNALMRRALDGIDATEVIAADAIAQLTPQATAEDAQSQTFFEVLDQAYKEAEARCVAQKPVTFRTSFEKLNSYDVIRPTFIVVASPSNHGKSAWLMNLGSDMAENDHKTAMFTLESTQQEIAWRWVSKQTGIPHSRVKDWQRLQDGVADMKLIAGAHAVAHRLPLYITRRIRTIDAIYSECRRMKTVHGLDAVLIDYFQLIGYPGGPRDREERLAQVAQRLLELALDLDIAVITASQLNKERLDRSSGRLHITDLKYAAALGESARVVLMFQRPAADDKANRDLRQCEVRFQVEKNNEGRTGDYEMHFDPITQRFGDGGCEDNNCRHLPRNNNADESTGTLFGT